MFNTTILDVAIGMVFIYLLLSLMCTAANEIIELALKKRAIDLERGIRELLAPGSESGADDIVRKLYNHPLVNSLFGGKYEESRIESTIKRKILRTALPSYIPTRTFALALMDLVLPGVTAPPAGAGVAGAAAAPPATPSGAAGATPPPPKFDVNLTAPPPPPPPITDSNNPLARLRSAVGANDLLTQHAKNALTPLIDAAGSDVAKARENIEGWFDTSMDRVSSWYKRRTQVVLIILGLFVAVTVNTDSITIAKRLSTDRSLRESLVSAAQDYAKANANTTPTPTATPTPKPNTKPGTTTPTTPTATPTPSPTPAPTATPTPTPPSDSTGKVKESPTATPSVSTACVKDPNSAECKHEKDLQKIPACAKDRNSPRCKFEEKCGDKKDSPECRYQESLLDIQSLSLPIGWDSQDDIGRQWPGWHWKRYGGWWYQIYWHLLGWLLTALAISLGAPFWFDLLNKFIVIRSAVKPHEKSPEEGSKD
jgi:type II secretory pathway pseudopilin PulG